MCLLSGLTSGDDLYDVNIVLHRGLLPDGGCRQLFVDIGFFVVSAVMNESLKCVGNSMNAAGSVQYLVVELKKPQAPPL